MSAPSNTNANPADRLPPSSPRAKYELQQQQRRRSARFLDNSYGSPSSNAAAEEDEEGLDHALWKRKNWKMMNSRALFGDLRNDLTAAALEFVGTIVFLIIGLGGIQAAATSSSLLSAAANSTSSAQSVNAVASIEQLLYISASMGLGLLVAVWLFYRVTGGVFNPAVATALLLVGGIGPTRFVLYCLAQLLGAIVASAILLGLVPGPLVVTPSLGPGVNPAQGVFIEMFLTSFLVFAVLMLAAEKHRSTAFAPIGIGLTLFACHLFGVLYTGAGMNAARSFGPAVVSGFSREHWVYWVGPFLGSLLATALYAFLKHVKYWKLNPDQDTPDYTQSPDDPVARAKALSLSVASRGSRAEEEGRDSDLTYAPSARVEKNGNTNMTDGRLSASPPPLGPPVGTRQGQGKVAGGEKAQVRHVEEA